MSTYKRAENGNGKVEVKSVKHTFSAEERNQIGGDLARAIGTERGILAEFDQVKASYKAKTAEAEARIDSLSTSLLNGFEMRSKRCVVLFFTAEKKKHYFLEDSPDGADPVLTEEMTPADFQTELIEAESKFEAKEEIELYNAGADHAALVIGRFNKLWFGALRANVGARKLEERLDSEQACAKKRWDMIQRTEKRFQAWLKDNLGKEAAKGFEGPIAEAIAGQREREE